MSRFKITKKYYSPDVNDFLYLVYERELLFFWNCLSSHTTLEHARHHIASILEGEAREKKDHQTTRKEELVSYF